MQMISATDIRVMGKRMLWLFMPLVFAWYLACSFVLVPLSLGINSIWIERSFSELSPSVVETTDAGWALTANLFVSQKNYLNNSFHPELRTDGTTEIPLTRLKSSTMGLAIFWLLAVAFRLSLKAMFFGTGILLALTVIGIGIQMQQSIVNVLVGLDSQPYSYMEGYVIKIPVPSDTAQLLGSIVFKLVYYSSAFVVPPALLVWFYNNKNYLHLSN